MARLPSALDLSGPENLRSGRQIAEYDTSAAGRGLQNLGADIVAIANEKKDQANVVDLARAEAAKTEGLLATQNQFDHDPEYATFGKRAPAATTDVVSKAGNLIRDPKMREKWLAQSGSDVARTNDSIFDWGNAKARDAETNAFDDALEANRRLYVDPNTPQAVKDKARKDIEGAIQAGQSSGLLDPNAAAARRKTYIEDADFSRGMLVAENDYKAIPGHRGPVAGIVAAAAQRHGVPPAIALGIAQIESGMNPNAKAPTSSAGGLFQFVDGTAAQYHLRNKFDPEANADAGARLTADNITGLRRDLGREPTPGEVYIAHFGGYGVAEKLGKASDNTPTSEIFSPAAIAANRSILAGKTAGEVKDWADRTMAKAMGQAGAAANPEWWDRLSPEQRQAVQNKAETQRNQDTAQAKANIDVAVTNGPTAVQNTGTYSGSMPSADEFFQAYGPQEGASRYNNFVSSMQTSKQAFDMRTMSADDIQTMVKQASNVSNGENAANDQAKLTYLQNAAESTIKAREADPATYVRQAFPAVNQAWNDAQSQGNYQAPVAASIAAQQQLGIKNVQPLPKEIADGAVKVFKDETQPQQNRIAAVSSILMATPDAHQRQLLFNQMVGAGLPDITEGAFEALSRGDQGAANRLFQAAMVDPTKLAGQAKEGQKPADIDLAVQNSIMDQGQVGDLYYGLSDGTADNYTRAQRDSKLINNAVNLRLRNGETMESAIASVSKDLYGDVVPVNDANVQILVPKGEDANAVVSGLHAAMPDVQAALTTSLAPPKATDWPSQQKVASLKLTPQEQHLYQHHIDNLNNNKFVRNDDGSVSTIYQTSIDIQGKTYNFPTVWDGKILPPNEAADRAIKEKGLDYWPSYANPDAAESRYQTMHSVMDGDIAVLDNRSNGNNAVMDAVSKDSIDRVMNEGYFRNSGDGYVFIDPYVGAAIADEQGNPIIFKPKAAVGAAATRQPFNQNTAPLTDDAIANFQKRMGAQ